VSDEIVRYSYKFCGNKTRERERERERERAIARPSGHCMNKLQTLPPLKEGAPQQENNKFPTVIKI
jgi:hypothetical protein